MQHSGIVPCALNQRIGICHAPPRYIGKIHDLQCHGPLKIIYNQDWVVNNASVRDWDVTDFCVQDRDAEKINCIQNEDVWHPYNLDQNTKYLFVESQNANTRTVGPLRPFYTFDVQLLKIAALGIYDLAVVLSDIAAKTYAYATSFIPCREWWPPYIHQLDLTTTYNCLMSHITISDQCRRIKIYLMQCLFRCHDFVAIQRLLCCIRRRDTTIFVLCSVLIMRIPALNLQLFDDIPLTNHGIVVDGEDTGGGRTPTFYLRELQPYMISNKHFSPDTELKYIAHNHQNVANAMYGKSDDHVYGRIPLEIFASKLTLPNVKTIAKVHGVHVPSRLRIDDLCFFFKGHTCACCETHVSVFALRSVKTNSERSKKWYDSLDASHKKEKQMKDNLKGIPENRKRKKAKQQREKRKNDNIRPPPFPPAPPSTNLKEAVIRGWCEDTSPKRFMEGGCAVCGQLVPVSQMSELSTTKYDLNILNRDGMGLTRRERTSLEQPVQEIEGAVLDEKCTNICVACQTSLESGLTPKYALANGLWLGTVPPQLQNLSFAEQLLISRVRRNRCVVQVSSGMHKMKANVIMFENPMPKIYQRLPPPLEDLDEVLAFLYTGPCWPTEEDLERTPLLVRKNRVSDALEWLKLNHADYHDLDVAYDNLDTYPDKGPPVVVTYRGASTNKNPESASAFDNETEEGVDSGSCPFVVNGLIGEKLTDMGPTALAARAARHLKQDGGKVLAISHAEKPESMYDNPQLYPMMFPWLFPYGLGGIGGVAVENAGMSDMMHKRKLLMYHDKRFQMDAHFPLVAFNQEQMKNSTTGGYLLTERRNFDDIAERLMNVDTDVLEDLSKRLSRGDRVKPVTDEEKACYALISDLDHVGGHVPGSITSKKYLRNEIWSLISYIGAPSWFITFAPADNKHPICLYYADTKETYSPELRSSNECYRLIVKNPVAGARFFHVMVQMFIKHVLGVDGDHPGLYGNTSAYYGTVEQQGRLTLHLHLLLWIAGCLTPQEIRDKIMDVNSDFQKKMVEYLESLCIGEFLTGSKIDISERISNESKLSGYHDPTYTLPNPPPPPCNGNTGSCSDEVKAWWTQFENTVDDLLLRSNQHTHTIDKHGNNTSYCTNAKGQCKRRFPRDTFEQTMVDPKTGALNLKKGEAWMNTFTAELTYLLRSNSDVTSLLSGTAIKAIVAYVSDYITKPGLKTYSIFDIIRSVFDKNSEMMGGDVKRKEKVRKVFTQIVNSLTAKMEIGSPMASLYILGNPDHYTKHKFIPFYWRGYVKEVLSAWEGDDSDKIPDLEHVPDKVVINKSHGGFIGISKVSDYVYRPVMYEDISLYDWIRFYKKARKHKMPQKKIGDAADDPEFADSDDELNIQPIKTCKSVDGDMQGEKSATSVSNAPLDNFIEDDIKYLDDDEDENKNEDEDEDEECSSDRDELDVMEELAEHIPKKDYSFGPCHSQYHTHKAHMQKEDPLVVPNFLPNILPRSDRGDREYYCCTMLTFFKPWRTGRDLRVESDTWDKSFMAYEFTKQQIEIMKYFNVRYECLDARDDFSAKRDKEGDDNICYQWATSDILAELDDLHDSEQAMSGADFGSGEDENEDVNTLKTLGNRGRSKRNEMLAAERTMKHAGWLDDCVDGPPNVGSLEPIKPEFNQPAKAWRATVLAKKQEILDQRSKHLPANCGAKSKTKGFKPNTVEVVDKAYIDQAFKIDSTTDERLVVNTVKDFHLNIEQERAFRIVSNHAMMDGPEKLRMYLGGMGGTGKSRVIEALMHFFCERKENHRFLVVAPTGAAAALLNGSTYHSVLGINDGEFVSAKTLAQIKARLDGVDYIFLDEVSMISCRDMYKISAQACKARGTHDEPFGGINFIFAGDFAQLPPARSGPPLYSGNVGTQMHSGQSVDGQEAAIGKALWHQVTTVVILRQNMRQAQQSAEDSMLRTALENMRYKSCTPEDITFLRTRIADKGPNDPKLAQKRFRNVSVITARNAQRDKINELGCERFAAENAQNLTSFYSIDRWRNLDESRGKKGRPKKPLIDPVRKTNMLSPDLQNILWEQPPASSDKHVAAKLTLCVGMPVMLKHNDATECCMTKGAEATVVSWQTSKGPEGQLVLETLFVKLVNPPKTVKLPGLPDNVVPITRHTTATMCYLPNDDQISISRDQVLVLLNFAMTDYSSQGRTRPDNVVDLNSCHTHQSYYTCLSRSATAAGTIIVQGFDPKVITGGASGYLRQEFRELEILDEITRMKYEKLLPNHITGNRRNSLIRQFQEWKGTNYVPKNVHNSIRWNKHDPLDSLNVVTDSPWQIIQRGKQKGNAFTNKPTNSIGFVAAKGSVPVTVTTSKRPLDVDDRTEVKAKRTKLSEETTITKDQGPSGFVWDGENYSCAYDSVLTILLSIWMQNPSKWKGHFKDMNRIMNVLASGFHRSGENGGTLESARNKVRHLLHQRNPTQFPYGQAGTPVSEMVEDLLRSDNIIASNWIRCVECNRETNLNNDLQTCVIQCTQYKNCSTSECLQKKFQERHPRRRCTECNGELERIFRFDVIPKILVFSVQDADITISKKISFKDGDERVTFSLKGIVYFGDFHYTSRVCSGNSVWFHDGMTTGKECAYEKKLSDFTDFELTTCQNKIVSQVIYAQK